MLVIQNNIGNRFSPTVIVASITSRQTKAHLPTHVNVGKVPGMNSRSIILLEQVRTIDKSRLLLIAFTDISMFQCVSRQCWRIQC